jgi:hypothetical protein
MWVRCGFQMPELRTHYGLERTKSDAPILSATPEGCPTDVAIVAIIASGFLDWNRKPSDS